MGGFSRLLLLLLLLTSSLFSTSLSLHIPPFQGHTDHRWDEVRLKLYLSHNTWKSGFSEPNKISQVRRSVGASVQSGPTHQLWLHSFHGCHGPWPSLQNHQKPFVFWWSWINHKTQSKVTHLISLTWFYGKWSDGVSPVICYSCEAFVTTWTDSRFRFKPDKLFWLCWLLFACLSSNLLDPISTDITDCYILCTPISHDRFIYKEHLYLTDISQD